MGTTGLLPAPASAAPTAGSNGAATTCGDNRLGAVSKPAEVPLAESWADKSPAAIATVAELMTWLSQRGEGYGYAFENPKVIRAAIDKSHVRADARITGAGEIAFFPPMTGG